MHSSSKECNIKMEVDMNAALVAIVGFACSDGKERCVGGGVVMWFTDLLQPPLFGLGLDVNRAGALRACPHQTFLKLPALLIPAGQYWTTLYLGARVLRCPVNLRLHYPPLCPSTIQRPIQRPA